jgi:hypothetical protein
MANCSKNIFVLFALAVAASGICPAQVQISAQVDTSEDIYVGESFIYHIIIDGQSSPGQPDLAPLAKYDPQSTGNQNISQSSIRIVNGQTTKSVVERYLMSYSLTANQAGRITLPSVKVTLDGKKYETNPVEVNILKPDTTDKLDLEVELSEEQCYVGQPVVMTVKFFVSADVGDFQFNIPAFTSGDFYIEDPDISGRQVKEFRLNMEMTAFISQSRVIHNGKEAALVKFSKILIPRRSGRIQIEPTTVSADVAVGRARSRGLFDNFFNQKTYKRYMVSSSASVLEVLPLTENGRPSEFYGLVGRYKIMASATPTKVNVGDPITLTIKIGGNRFLKPIQWPKLEEIPELADNFKVPAQKSSPSIENGFKVFTQTIRANNDEVTEIPSIPLAFFDPDKGRYLIVGTDPIPLEVAHTKVLTSADLEGEEFVPVNKEVEAIKKGLSANYDAIDVLENMAFSPLSAAISSGYTVIWAVPFAALMVSALIKIFTHTTPEKIAVRRRRQARGSAIGRLKRLGSESSQQQAELLVSVMKEYIGERFDKIAGSLTAEDCFEIIRDNTQETRYAEKYREIITECETARYASGQINIDSTPIKEAINLIDNIEKKSRK